MAKFADFSDINADELLLKATENGWSLAGVQMLVNVLKADVNVTDQNSYTPLTWACVKGRDEVAKFLIKNGSDTEKADSYNNTPLIMATRSGHEGCVRILLPAGASVKARNRGGKSALDYALDLGEKRILRLLRGEFVSLPKESTLYS